MNRSAPLRGLLAGVVALVLFASSAVALAAGSATTPVPPQLPVAAAAPVAASPVTPDVAVSSTAVPTVVATRGVRTGDRGHNHAVGPDGGHRFGDAGGIAR